MGICVRVVRGLALSCLILGGILVGAGCVTVASSGVAVAQTASSIVVEGRRRVEADTIRSYFKPGPGGRLDYDNRLDAGVAAYWNLTRLLTARDEMRVAESKPPIQTARCWLTGMETPSSSKGSVAVRERICRRLRGLPANFLSESFQKAQHLLSRGPVSTRGSPRGLRLPGARDA